MGYYTDFDFSDNSQEVIEAIYEISDYRHHGVGGKINAAKWYDHKEHCLEVSKKFPDQVITVYGEGEESGDIWKAYYKNGKSFQADAIITFEDFNESKLR